MVNPGQGKTILRASTIQICEVDAHSPLLVCFLGHDNIGQPFKIINFSDKIGSKQFVHFIHDNFVSFRGKSSSPLLDGLLLRAYIEVVLDNVCWDTRHVFMALRKHVEVILKEADNLFPRLCA